MKMLQRNEITVCDEDYLEVGQEAETKILDGTPVVLENGKLSPAAALWMHQNNVAWEIQTRAVLRKRRQA